MKRGADCGSNDQVIIAQDEDDFSFMLRKLENTKTKLKIK